MAVQMTLFGTGMKFTDIGQGGGAYYGGHLFLTFRVQSYLETVTFRVKHRQAYGGQQRRKQ